MLNANKLIRILATGLAATAVAASATACAPTQNADTTPDPVAAQPEKPASEDLSFDDLEPVKVTGALYSPEALGYPSMVRVNLKRAPGLDKQRKRFARARPNKKPLEGKVLVTLLWEEANQMLMKAETDEAGTPETKAAAKQTALEMRNEARMVLRELHESLGEAFDDVLLQMLFTAELWMGDKDAAVIAGQELVDRFADSPSAKVLAPWVAYVYLEQGKIAEAAQITEGWTLEPTTDYSHAYVMSWVAFHQGDFAQARDALAHAANDWKIRGTWPVVEREMALMLARAGTPVEEAAATIAALSENLQGNQFYWLYQLNDNYAKIGAFSSAAAALDKAMEVAGSEIPQENVVSFRTNQANYYLLEYDPAAAAAHIIQAHQALGTCGDKCATMVEAVTAQIAKMAPYLHTIYTTTLDERYYEPAKQLYEYYLTLNRPDAETLRTYLSRLEETNKVAGQVPGKHSKEIMERATGVVRVQAVQGCYEGALQGEPTLEGTVQVVLGIDAAGQVTGATVEPAPGEEGLGAVAKCLDAKVRTWTFPGRSLPGTTRVVRSFVLESPVEPAAATQPATEAPATEAPATEAQPGAAQ